MAKFVGQPQVLKAVNSAMIAQLIDERGPLSKPELARLTCLSLPTVNKLVDELESGGSIRSAGFAGKGAGRKAALYETNKGSSCLLALYYQETHLLGRVTDIGGEALYEAAFALDGASAEAATADTVRAIDALKRHAPSVIKAIGVGVPGAIQPDGRILGIPKVPGWEGYDLAGALAARYDTGICVENDVKLSAVGYYHAHLSDAYENIVYIYAGNGMGSGIIINKKLYRGSTNFSGEFGFMAPLTGMPPGRDYTGEGGYLEARLRETSCAVRGAYGNATPEQREVLVNILGSAAVNHVAVLNPDAIVFGGEAFDDELIGRIRAQMLHYVPREIMPRIVHDDSRTTGIDGLILACRGYITTRMQLVQDGGV